MATQETDSTTPDRDPNALVPVDSARRYVRIRPTDAALDGRTVESQFRRLHGLTPPTGDGVFDRLRGPARPTVEWLLTTHGQEFTYLVRIDPGELLDGLERQLRSVFPDSYEFDRVTETSTSILPDGADGTMTGVAYRGCATQRGDWQTKLQSFADLRPAPSDHTEDSPRIPLASVVETMADSPLPVTYQVLLRPTEDWSVDADVRRLDIEEGTDTLGGRLSNAVFGPPPEGEDVLLAADRDRLAHLDERDARRSFVVNARALITAHTPSDDFEGQDPAAVARELASAFGHLGHDFHEVDGTVLTGGDAESLAESIRTRRFVDAEYDRLTTKLPWRRHTSRGIVCDASEAPSFCLLDGDALTDAGLRILAPTQSEQTSLRRPPEPVLDRYRGPGLPLGRARTEDNVSEQKPLSLPRSLQSMHLAWFGRTGSGKTTSLINAILENHTATDGADVLIDPKGDGMATEYLRAHYATYGHLDDVVYFDCARCLPAFSFFDIRDELAAGVPRTTAVEDSVDHYLEILSGIMGRERFEQAVRSPDVIRYLIKALFDPVHGADAFSHRSLHGAARRMHERQSAPAVSDDDLERMLGGVVANRARSYDEIMQGVANRLEKVPVDQRLAKIFNHVPEEGDAHFDLAHYLNEDVVVVIDTGGLRTDAQRVLTLVILSNLWTALRRRSRRAEKSEPKTHGDSSQPSSDESSTDNGAGLRKGPAARRRTATQAPQGASEASDRGAQRDSRERSEREAARRAVRVSPAARVERSGASEGREHNRRDTPQETDANNRDHPLVNLYIEEAASVANSELLTELLAQSRGFDCSVTLAMQFPAQLRTSDERTYEEVLNNVGTVVTGNVQIDRRLAERFATDDMPPERVGNRLRALERGEWLVRLPASFGDRPPRPFLVDSLPLPPGDPEGAQALSGRATRAFKRAVTTATARTERDAGLTLGTPSTIDDSEGASEDDGDESSSSAPLTSVLAYTKRLPETVEYAAEIHALRCTECDARYDPVITGMTRAIECCSSLDAVDRDDIPVCSASLKLTPEERGDSEWSTRQLLFLQVVYNAQQLRYDDLEYDLLFDSMLRLQEYVGIDTNAVQDLIDADLLRHDTDHPHRLYSVTPRGRGVIGERYRRGVDYGHGKGDLEESTEHVFGVVLGIRLLESAYRDDPESAVETVVPYYELREGDVPMSAFMGDDADASVAIEEYEYHRFDIVGLDSAGEIVVTLEVERVNHDLRRAVPEDFDKMAACDPEESIWIVMSRTDGHAVLGALNDPLEGDARVEKTYSENTPPQQFRIDTPGLTAIYPAEYVRDSLLD